MALECSIAGGSGGYYCALYSAPAIIIGALGLAGVMSLKAVSISALLVSPIGFVPGVLGLCGAVSAHVVSGVILAGGLIGFMISCCLSTGTACVLLNMDRNDPNCPNDCPDMN